MHTPTSKPSSDDSPSSTAATPGPLADRGTWVVGLVVLVGLGASLAGRNPSAAFVLQALGLGLAYLVLAHGLGDRLLTRDDRRPLLLWAYFVSQPIVLVLLATLFAQNRTFGVIWLLHMPLVSHSRMLLPLPGTIAVCLSSLGTMAYHVAAISGWEEVPSALFELSTAVFFVLLFTDIAMRESSERARSQRLGEELEEANRRLGAYAVQAEELSAARERTRVAREIHDSVGHSLTAVHMQIEAARTLLDRDPEKTRAALEKAQQSIKEGLTEIRRSVSTLRADPLDGRGLHQALVDLANNGTDSGLPVQFRVSGRQRPLTPDVSLVLFRCAQEGLTNARKHAQARRVDLRLDYGDTDEAVRFEVRDDGVGADRAEGGYGLLGLRERAHQLGGRVDVRTSPGEGLSLEVHIPTKPFTGEIETGEPETGEPETEEAEA